MNQVIEICKYLETGEQEEMTARLMCLVAHQQEIESQKAEKLRGWKQEIKDSRRMSAKIAKQTNGTQMTRHQVLEIQQQAEKQSEIIRAKSGWLIQVNRELRRSRKDAMKIASDLRNGYVIQKIQCIVVADESTNEKVYMTQDGKEIKREKISEDISIFKGVANAKQNV